MRWPRGSSVWLSLVNSPEKRLLCPCSALFHHLRDVTMLTRRSLRFAAVSILCVSLLALAGLRAATETLPSQLTDQEFWKLSTEFSEPDGFFRSDNLLSNEVWLQRVIPDLLNTVKTP